MLSSAVMAVYDFIVTRGAAAVVVEDEDCCPFAFDCVFFFVARRQSLWIIDAIQRNECEPVPASKKSPKDTGGGGESLSLATSLLLVLELVLLAMRYCST